MIVTVFNVYMPTATCVPNLLFMVALTIMEDIFEGVSIKHGLRTTDCGLGIKYGLGIK